MEADLDQSCLLSPETKECLAWWVTNLPSIKGKPIKPEPSAIELSSDASLSGWGAVLETRKTSGRWSPEERLLHINSLELLAALKGLQCCEQFLINRQVILRIDNMSAVCYINNVGGTKSFSMCKIACEIAHWCESRNVVLSAVHIPGVLNILADQESRRAQDPADWMLNPEVFQRIAERWSPEVDLFASSWNNQLPKLISWNFQPGALATDSLSQSWKHLQGYAFPPFCLLGKVLSKVLEEEANITLICPWWPSQHWWPALLNLTSDVILILQNRSNLIFDSQGNTPPSLKRSTRFLACRLSGNISEVKAFRATWSNWSSRLIVNPHKSHTIQPGMFGVIGRLNKATIPCLLL